MEGRTCKWKISKNLLAAALFAVFFLLLCGEWKEFWAGLPAGEYSSQVSLTGGSGRAGIESPAAVTVSENGIYVRLVWSSPYYDYMLVGEDRYLNLSGEGENSSFLIPIEAFDEPVSVVADTLAMSRPHEIEYEITVKSPDEGGGILEWIADFFGGLFK